MSRRQLAFIILINALISTVIALAVAFAVDARRPDPEELAALYTPAAPVVIAPAPNIGLAPTFTPTPPVALPTATAVAPTAGGNAGQDQIYVVEAGDSLLGIALRFGVSLDALMTANRLNNPDFVFVGQRLTIPAPPTAPTATPAPSQGGAAAAPLRAEGVVLRTVTGSGDLAAEQILIVNDSNSAFNLQGWTLQISGGSAGLVYSFGSLPLFPGGSVRLHSARGVDSSVDLYWGQSAPLFAAGANLRLVDNQGATVHTLILP